MEFRDNLFVPAGAAAVFLSMSGGKDEPETNHDLETFESWGFASGNKLQPGTDSPPIPEVIRAAMVMPQSKVLEAKFRP